MFACKKIQYQQKINNQNLKLIFDIDKIDTWTIKHKNLLVYL
jgi:hypothetical protein